MTEGGRLIKYYFLEAKVMREEHISIFFNQKCQQAKLDTN